MLLAESVPDTGRVLVHGAGGGLEMRSLAGAQSGWTFDGVDPSADMLDTARRTVAPHADRMRFHHGYIDAAPEGPFDAATSLLTFHFIAADQRLATLRNIRRRLRPGAPFVLAISAFRRPNPTDRHGSPATSLSVRPREPRPHSLPYPKRPLPTA